MASQLAYFRDQLAAAKVTLEAAQVAKELDPTAIDEHQVRMEVVCTTSRGKPESPQCAQALRIVESWMASNNAAPTAGSFSGRSTAAATAASELQAIASENRRFVYARDELVAALKKSAEQWKTASFAEAQEGTLERLSARSLSTISAIGNACHWTERDLQPAP